MDEREDFDEGADDERGPARGGDVAQDDLSELVDPDVADVDEQADDDLFDLDQKELDELGLTLDDPHQPGPE